MVEALALKVERIIKASAEKIYKAWLDPETLKKFMIPGQGMSCPEVSTRRRQL